MSDTYANQVDDGTSEEYIASPAGFSIECLGFDINSATFELEGNTVQYSVEDDDVFLSTAGQDIRPYTWLRVDPPAPAQLQRDALYNEAAQHDARAATWESMARAAEDARRDSVGSTSNDGERGARLASVFAFLKGLFHKNKANELRDQADEVAGQ